MFLHTARAVKKTQKQKKNGQADRQGMLNLIINSKLGISYSTRIDLISYFLIAYLYPLVFYSLAILDETNYEVYATAIAQECKLAINYFLFS